MRACLCLCGHAVAGVPACGQDAAQVPTSVAQHFPGRVQLVQSSRHARAQAVCRCPCHKRLWCSCCLKPATQTPPSAARRAPRPPAAPPASRQRHARPGPHGRPAAHSQLQCGWSVAAAPAGSRYSWRTEGVAAWRCTAQAAPCAEGTLAGVARCRAVQSNSTGVAGPSSQPCEAARARRM